MTHFHNYNKLSGDTAFQIKARSLGLFLENHVYLSMINEYNETTASCILLYAVRHGSAINFFHWLKEIGTRESKYWYHFFDFLESVEFFFFLNFFFFFFFWRGGGDFDCFWLFLVFNVASTVFLPLKWHGFC